MGLSSPLSDVASDSIPILLVAAAASWVSYLRSSILFLLHSLGILHRLTPPSSHASIGSGLGGGALAALAQGLANAKPFLYGGCAAGSSSEEEEDCVICLCGLAPGDRVRRLPCRHIFHADCHDGWLDQMRLSCPICRSSLVAAAAAASDVDRLSAADLRIGAELVAWLSPY